MFLYINFRKNVGLISSQGFHKEDKLGAFVLAEIGQLIGTNKNDHGHKNCPDSKALENHLYSLKNPSIDQLRDLIKRYEEWAQPFVGPALVHDIQEHSLLKDTH